MDSHTGDDMSVGEVEPMPGYADLITRASTVMPSALRGCSTCGLELSKRTLLDNAYITWTEIGLFFICAIMWTQIRRGLTECLFQPFAQWCSLQPKDSAKMPESSWKLVFYTMSWSYSTYLLFFTNYTFFHDPPSVFYEWKRGMTVPTDIAIAYLIQGSFYGHSIYATVYMDAWRKDSTVMVVHHVITLALITFSYAFRFHNIGLLVLFLHDINDIQLEFTKLNVYFKTRGGGYYLINDILSNMGSVSFSITWFWFRLYWFPLKVLYATCVSSLQSVPNIPFYFFFNSLLLTLLCMNIYWFLYIVAFVAKVLTGQMKDVKDLREYEGEEGAMRAATLLKVQQQSKDAGHLNNSAETQLNNSTEGKHLQNGITKEKHL
ncbi:ceramide synthase 1-like isoform 2-T3 [Salvelinus alpinus]|uniref:ceramide synthase 1-like isoform X2 n=1 Tax=Salvelinus sp. IW2-2015 TaxID=2691554 RepID=UPI000CDF5B65|nr:ceramide synthase 1-like isoform X2 [Salvelinus alpinus]